MNALLHSLMPDIYGLLFIGLLYAFMVWVLPRLQGGSISVCKPDGRVHDADH